MVKKLTKHGNSLALVIDRPILDLLKIDPETLLEVSTDGKQLIVNRRSSRPGGKSSTRRRNGSTRDTVGRSGNWPSEATEIPLETLFLTLDEVLEIREQQNRTIRRLLGSPIMFGASANCWFLKPVVQMR